MATAAKIQIIPGYVSTLRQRTGYYIGYIPNTYADQATADGYYEVIRKDVEIARCMHLLSLMAAGERIRVEAEEPYKKLSLFALSNIDDFVHARKSLIEKGTLFGLGIQRKYYGYETEFGQKWQVIKGIQEVDRRRLRIERDTEDRNELYWTIWCPRRDKYIIIEERGKNPLAGPGCAVEDYVWYIHSYEELSPYFEGFGDTLYTLSYISTKALQYWADLSESWAKPFLIAMVDLASAAVNANLGAGFVSATQRAKDLISTFEKARARHMVVIDKTDEVRFHEHGTTGNNIIEGLIQYCDKKKQLMILGSELSTTSGGIGSYKLGAVHKEQTDTIVLYHRYRLAEILFRDIVQDFFFRNQASLRRIGLRIPRKNEVKIKIEVEFEELEKEQAQQEEQGKMPEFPPAEVGGATQENYQWRSRNGKRLQGFLR